MPSLLDKYNWSEWLNFPDPRKAGYLIAPFGLGLYQLKDIKSNKFILFGIGKNCSLRMTSLLPKPYGQGVRNNSLKRDYLLKNISNIQYRTIAFVTENEMKETEREIKEMKIHRFNT